MGTTKNKVICQNKRAHYDYFIEDVYECGIVLSGTEIKSVRLGKVSVNESFCYIKDGEVYIDNMHISQKNLEDCGCQMHHQAYEQTAKASYLSIHL